LGNGNGICPKPTLDVFRTIRRLVGADLVEARVVEIEAGIDVLAQKVPSDIAIGLGEHAGAEINHVDGNGFFYKSRATLRVAGHGQRQRETE
jgi:hypothetical protein